MQILHLSLPCWNGYLNRLVYIIGVSVVHQQTITGKTMHRGELTLSLTRHCHSVTRDGSAAFYSSGIVVSLGLISQWLLSQIASPSLVFLVAFPPLLSSVLSSLPASCQPPYLKLKSIPRRCEVTLVESLSPAPHAQTETHMGNKRLNECLGYELPEMTLTSCLSIQILGQ